jgi:hypothetical protein
MEALFKIKASEFNETLFEKIKSLIKGRDIEITIAVTENAHTSILNEDPAEYVARIKQAETDINTGLGTHFTMEELKSFIEK